MSDKTSGDIAIVGMACMFPGADTPQRFWANICQKLEFVGEPLPGWDAERYLQATGTSFVPTSRGGYLGEAFAADAAEMGVMPSSVDGSEPDQFLALRIAKAALADAGALDHNHTRTGVILGHSTYLHRGNAAVVQHGVVLDQTRALLGQLLPGADPAVLDRVRAELASRLPPFNADTAPGLVPNVMTGRIANKLDLRGPNYLIDAACSSSLLAVQAAMHELRAGRSDLMLAGGVNASISAEVYMVFHQLGALAKSGHVRPFTEGGDGTLLGEGLGVLALKRLDDALATGERIYAVIKGVGQSSDGRGGGLLAPRMEGEMLAIERALQDAGLTAIAPGLIEAHGTGIPLGDRTEINALRGMYGARAEDGLPRTAIGSVKSMIGHCIPAAGAAGMIKASLALYHRVLPPTISDKARDGLGIETTKLYLNTETRPWISSPDEKRRAAVNAFGFGGINAHVLLEEAPTPAPTPRHWPEELVILSAENPIALALSARDLAAAVERHPTLALSELAYAAASGAGTGPARLAVVADSREDLIAKLQKAAERLEAGKTSLKMRSGVFAEARPLDGKLAFIFPGEGAQYQGMLQAALTVLPEARAWFDFWDGLFPDRVFPPSASVFPPPSTLDPALAKTLSERLFGLELGSESVFIAAQALLSVTERLGIKPDAVVGHSSGEHSALAAAGVLGQTGTTEDRAEFAKRIKSLNKLYQAMEAAGGIAGGALLTVGAVARDHILALVAKDPAIHLALDNCEHQAVLYGSRVKMEEAATSLRAVGGMCSFLPIERAYHTPLFGDVAAQVEEVYRGMEFRSPKLAIYSCMTAAPMPADPSDIRILAAGQWASRVRFTETVERLYADGVRLFLEVGPSANLTGFVEDTLKGREAVILAMDSRRRSGLGQMLQSLGRLWVAGRNFHVAALFDGRGLTVPDLAAAPAKLRMRFIDNTLPFVRLPQDVAQGLARDIAASMQGGVTPSPQGADRAVSHPTPELAVPMSTAFGRCETGDALSNHFGLMQQFLGMEGAIMEAAFGHKSAADTAPDFPLLHRIIAMDHASLTAETDFDPALDPFIAHHVFYTSFVSDADAELTALPVLPLAVSLELVAEATFALLGIAPSRLEQVRARDWVSFDDGAATLTIKATRLAKAGAAVQILRGDRVLFEAQGWTDIATSACELLPLASPKAPTWSDDQLYTTGMFHGPLFHGIASLQAWDESGLDATLADTSLAGFMEYPGQEQGLVLNPVLLDMIGHVTAFWIAQGLGTDFSSFPSSIDRIDLSAARTEETSGGRLSGRIQFQDSEGRPAPAAEARFLQGNYEGHGPDGTLLFRVSGWKDRFFRVPHAFYEARYRPRDAWYGAPLAGFEPGALVWQVPAFPAGFLDDAGGIWQRVLAATVLSRAERQTFAAMTGPMKRRRDWLMGRIAAKEAVRAWVLQQDGVAVLPADIEISAEPEGRPFAQILSNQAVSVPMISIAHSTGAAIAAAASVPVGADFEYLTSVDATLLAEGGFSAEERAEMGTTAEALLSGWCAKEAAAKSAGTGLTGRPKSFVLTTQQGGARVRRPDGSEVTVQVLAQGGTVVALALG
jgi:acyl transferase domain-containing protein/phosphopantetheinyl transferase